MKDLFIAILIELKKLKRSIIIWIIFIGFALIPIMGGLMMYLIKNPDLIPATSVLKIKISMLSTPVDWNSYLGTFILQGSGIVGIIAFGFVISYLFGREYVDRTYRDLLSLPVSRVTILNAKFVIYILWCLLLVIWDLGLGFIVGTILKLPGWNITSILEIIKTYFITSFLVISLGFIVSFFALWSRGYLAPLGFIIAVLFMANLAPYLGFAHYFPWSIPMLYAGMGGEELRKSLNLLSYICIGITFFCGYLLTVGWWKYSDQS